MHPLQCKGRVNKSLNSRDTLTSKVSISRTTSGLSWSCLRVSICRHHTLSMDYDLAEVVAFTLSFA